MALFPRSHCLFLAVFVSGGFILPTLSVWHQVNNKSLNLCVIIALLVTKLWDCIATCRLQLSLYPKKLVLLHYPSWTQISVETQLVSDCFSTLIWTLASFFYFLWHWRILLPSLSSQVVEEIFTAERWCQQQVPVSRDTLCFGGIRGEGECGAMFGIWDGSACQPASLSPLHWPFFFPFFFLHSCHLTLLTSLNVTAAHVNQTSCRSSSEPACWLQATPASIFRLQPVQPCIFFLLVAHPVACGWKCSLINFRTHPIQSCGFKLFYLLSAWTLIKDVSWFANCFVVYWWLSAIFRQKKKGGRFRNWPLNSLKIHQPKGFLNLRFFLVSIIVGPFRHSKSTADALPDFALLWYVCIRAPRLMQVSNWNISNASLGFHQCAVGCWTSVGLPSSASKTDSL